MSDEAQRVPRSADPARLLTPKIEQQRIPGLLETFLVWQDRVIRLRRAAQRASAPRRSKGPPETVALAPVALLRETSATALA